MTEPTTSTSGIDALEQLLASRRSCRGYRPEPVDDATIGRLLSAARLTPSWCNTQPWHVVVTTGDETQRLQADMAADERYGSDLPFPESYEGRYRDRRRESGWALYEAVGVEQGDRAGSAAQTMRNFEFFGAPHVAIVTTSRSLGVYGAIDCGLYVQSFLLAAEALGLGACAQAALAMRSELLRDWCDLDDDRQVVCGIAFGHPDPDHPAHGFRTTRAPLTETATIL